MKPRILVAHNRYLQRGGEDAVVDAELALLQSRGHAVELYERDNRSIDHQSGLASLRDTLWSSRTSRDLESLANAFRPDIIHVHNTFPLISPSIYWFADSRRIPIIQTLHNFRLMCAQAMLLRKGAVCDVCLGHHPWRGVLHKCYRGSYTQSAAIAGMLSLHRFLGTFSTKVTRYIALNDFCRNIFIQGGLPGDRIRVKPNFVDIPHKPRPEQPGAPLFIGRLSPEKGLHVLAAAMNAPGSPPADVIGSGPEHQRFLNHTALRFRGEMPPSAVYEAMRHASFLVIPSIWYENFPRTLVEAFACGTPVIASRIGALADLIGDGNTGLLFEPGSAADLRKKIDWALANPQKMAEMGHRARHRYEQLYTPEANYRILMGIYNEILARPSF